MDSKQKLIRLGRIFETARKKQGLTQQQLADQGDFSRSAYSKLVKGLVDSSRIVDDVTRVLGLTWQDLYGENLKEYTLSDAPVCDKAYKIKIESAGQLNLEELRGNQPVICLVVPWDQEARERARLGLFRKTGHQRAVLVEFLPDGDDLQIAQLRSRVSDLLQDGVSGEILGAIRDLISAEHLFRR